MKILARRGYVSRPEALISADSEIERDLLEAAASPIDLTSIPLQVTVGKTQDLAKVKRFPFALTVSGLLLATPSETGARYDMMVAVMVGDQDGVFKSPLESRLRGVVLPTEIAHASKKGLRYDSQFQAPIGSPYFGGVIVRDNLTGRIGTITLAPNNGHSPELVGRPTVLILKKIVGSVFFYS